MEIESRTPKITIGLVVYNGITHIRSALDSILRQPYKNIELIVVDGDSNDGTQNILNEYSEQISVFVSEPDKGIYDAMNKVCSLATGDWLIFLGCDDELLDSLVSVSRLMTCPDAIYYGDVILRSVCKVYGGKFSKYKLMRQNICHQAIFYPHSVYKKYTYSLNYKWLADHAYNLKLLGNGMEFIYTEVVVSIYNDTGDSSQGDPGFSRDQIKLIRESFGNTYALVEILRRRKVKLLDGSANLIGTALKRLLPYSYWKHCQSLWGRMRKWL